MCEPDPPNSRMEGYLLKRPRGRHRSVGPNAKFEKRFFRLTDDKLEYWKKTRKNSRGSFKVEDVKVIEEVHENVFGVPYCFQIANESECMYMVAPSQHKMREWMEALRQAVQRKKVDMLPFYHHGFHNQNKWTCCGKEKLQEEGCRETGNLPAASEGGGARYSEECLSDSLSSTLRRNPILSESLSSNSTLKSPDTSLNLSNDDPSHQSSTKPQPEIVVSEEGLMESRKRSDSGIGSGTNSAINSFSGKSGTSVLSESSSICEIMYDVLEKPQPTWGAGNKDEDKQKSAHFLSEHHQQLRVCKRLPLERVQATDTNRCSENFLEEVNHHDKSNAASASIKVAKQSITAVAFLSPHVVVVATEDHHVCILDVPKAKLLYDVKLTHSISTLDVWNDYILVGSSPVQLFEMKADRLRRIVVMDLEDNNQLSTASYLGAFLANGCFATVSDTGNEVVLWPKPTEEKVLMNEAVTRFTIENKSERIHRMWGFGDSDQPFLAIVKGAPGQTVAVDVFDCKNLTHTKELPKRENIFLTFEKSGRMEIEREYRSSVATIGRSQSSRACIPVALSDGTIVLYEDLTAFSTCNSDERARISSLMCLESNGSTLVAAGHENGKLGLWGGEPKIKPQYDLMEELFTTQVFLGDSFYRESLLRDDFEFTVDFNGGKFENYPSYSLEIPRGAIPEGEEVVIRTGIMKYGPCGQCNFPKSIDIVSPIVWFSSSNHKFQFLKPATLQLQHCCSTSESLVLLKADHHNMKNPHEVFQFQEQQSSNTSTSDRYYSTGIEHFCLFCAGKYSNNDGIQQGFLLTPVERVGYMNKTHQVTFCLSYDLDSCQQAVKEQYPTEDYRIKQALPVKFEDSTEIDIEYPHESISGWQVAQTYPGHPIGLEDLNWEERFPTQQALVSAHKKNQYPPRFILEFCGKDARNGVTITISLTNVTRPVSYDIILYMPCEPEECQEEIQVFPSSKLPDDTGMDDVRHSTQPIFHLFPSNVSPRNELLVTTPIHSIYTT